MCPYLSLSKMTVVELAVDRIKIHALALPSHIQKKKPKQTSCHCDHLEATYDNSDIYYTTFNTQSLGAKPLPALKSPCPHSFVCQKDSGSAVI